MIVRRGAAAVPQDGPSARDSPRRESDRLLALALLPIVNRIPRMNWHAETIRRLPLVWSFVNGTLRRCRTWTPHSLPRRSARTLAVALPRPLSLAESCLTSAVRHAPRER